MEASGATETKSAAPRRNTTERRRANRDRRRRGGQPHPVSLEQRRHEQRLLRQFALSRSSALREELIDRFMPLARSLAMRYRGGSEPLEDLVQVATLGLVKAVDGFDPARGSRFAAYAAPTILGELRRHFRDHVWQVHLPRSLQELTLAVEEAAGKLTEKLGRAPTVTQIAEMLEIEEEQVLEALHADQARNTLSLDAPRARGDADSAPTVECVGNADRGFDRVEAQLAASSADLDERERAILRLRFAEGLTQSEIGHQFGVSQMQISRIQRRALRKLAVAVRGGDELDESLLCKPTA